MGDSEVARQRLMQLLESDDENSIRHAAIEKARFVADRLSSPNLHIAEQLVTIAQRKAHVLSLSTHEVFLITHIS